jgi:hypothetical protein
LFLLKGKKIKFYEELYKNGQSNECVTVEYEVIDEFGNQILISGADKLKQMASCVIFVILLFSIIDWSSFCQISFPHQIP